ncbi:MAG TPA: sigma-70 family RNA polymerase sigma factor [Opitutus sp.]|nr:sigma-70 family RNA polymerase sigma factor [Opitutus sp.]
MDDHELLRRYVEDHAEEAFTELVRRHLGLVYSTALRRVGGDAHLAEDVAQQVFSDLARKAAVLRSRATLTGWLHVSTHVASAAVVRGEQRRKTRETAAHIMQTLLHDPGATPDPRDLRAVLDEAIVGLRDDEREAIALRFFEQRSFAEIGATLRLNEDAARKRVDRALEKLRLLLERRGVASTTALLSSALGDLASVIAPPGLATKIVGSVLGHAAAATASAGLATMLAPAAAIVGLALGGWAVLHQHRTNEALATEVARLGAEERAIDQLRAGNRRLAQSLHEADDLRRAAADLPALREKSRPAVADSAQYAPVRATVTLQPAGTLSWGKEPVTLREFIERLRDLERTAPDGNAKVGIRGLGEFSALAYVIGETRKSGVKHVVVESNAVIDPKLGHGLWFGRR